VTLAKKPFSVLQFNEKLGYKKMFPFGITYTESFTGICFKKVNRVHFDLMLTSVRETIQNQKTILSD